MSQKEAQGYHRPSPLLDGVPGYPSFTTPPAEPKPSIVIANNLAGVPPLLDAIPRRRPTYAIFDTREMWPTPQKPEETKDVSARLAETFGFVVATDLEFDNFGATSVQTARQLQRVGLFEDFTARIKKEEKRLDGAFSDVDFSETVGYMSWMRRIAFSLYQELRQEPFTKNIADDAVAKNTQQKGAEAEAVQQAEDLLRKAAFTERNVVIQAEKILFPNGKTIDKNVPELNKNAKEIKKKFSQEKNNGETSDLVDKFNEVVKKLEERKRQIAEELTVHEKPQQSGDIYVHDPVKDTPNTNSPTYQEEVAYLEEMWNRPF